MASHNSWPTADGLLLTDRHEVQRPEWNKEVTRLDGCAFHSYEWSLFAAENNHETPLYFRLEDKSGEVKALAVGYQRGKQIGGHTFFKTLSFGSFPACSESTLLEIMLKKITEYCRKSGIMELDIYSFGTPLQTVMISEIGFLTSRRWEFLLEFPESEELLWDKIHSKKRNLIRKAQKEGVRVALSPELDQVMHLRDLGIKTQRRKVDKGISFPAPPPGENYYRLLKEKLIDCGLGRLYLAYKEESPIAGAFFLGFNGKAYYMLSAAGQEGLEMAAPDLILWTAMTDYLREGYRLFNFGGLAESELDGRPLEESGLYHFKKRFSSEEHLCYKGFLRIRPFTHNVFQLMKSVRSRVLS